MCAMMTKLRIWACSTGSAEPNTVLGSGMPVRQWLWPAVVLVLVGCQSGVPATPTAAVAVPTAAPVPTAPPVATTRVGTLNAAHAAFRTGDLKTAAGLYDRVVNTPPNQGEAAVATSASDDYARFRGMITVLADGPED